MEAVAAAAAADGDDDDDVWTSPPFQRRRGRKLDTQQPADTPASEDVEPSPGFKRRKTTKRTEEELYALGKGVVRYGESAWNQIVEDEELGKVLAVRTIESIVIKWSRVPPSDRKLYMRQDKAAS